jgi:hypothetical protein
LAERAAAAGAGGGDPGARRAPGLRVIDLTAMVALCKARTETDFINLETQLEASMTAVNQPLTVHV